MAKGQRGCVNQSCETWAGGEKKKFYNDTYDFCPKCGQPLKYVCKRCGMELPDGSKKYCERCENEIKDERDRKLETFAKGIQKSANKIAKFAGEKYKDIASDLEESKDKLGEAVGDAFDGMASKIDEITNKLSKNSKNANESKERFIINDGDMREPNDDIICRTCKFRNKKFEDGYKRCTCEKYNNLDNDKPSKILFENQKCEFYEKDLADEFR